MDFFTSDWHLNDEMILKVCKRGFKSAARMTEVIVNQANQRAKLRSDNIIHVGDFIQRGLDRGTGDKKTQVTAKEVLANMWANVVLIEGNHDYNNRCNTIGKVLFRRIGDFDCIVQHLPSDSVVDPVEGHSPGMTPFLFNVPSNRVLINICGHVHKRWAFHFDKDRRVLNVNVGYDIYPYMIKECELLDKIRIELHKLAADVRVTGFRSFHPLRFM